MIKKNTKCGKSKIDIRFRDGKENNGHIFVKHSVIIFVLASSIGYPGKNGKK